jgi:copper chaperone CopZ
MKNLKLKISVITVFTVIFISAILLSGCTKQDKKEITENKEKKTENEQQQNATNNTQQDLSTIMNKDDAETNKDNKPKMDKEKMDMSKGNVEHKMIKIPTAQCETCKENITKALKKVNGVKTFEVDIDNKIVHINFDKEITDLNKIENAITSAGYDANNKKANPDAYSKLDDCCKKPEDRKNKK